jgi:hypothetical protein
MVSNLLASLRVRMFMPHPSETEMDGKPGWQPTGAEQRQQLERVGQTFLTGLRVGLEGVPTRDIAGKLAGIDRQFRGFAYEGCAMGLAVADSLSMRPRRLREYLAGPAADHVYMAHIGIGWGLARSPRMRWRAVIPPDPLHRWLALDGLGFHQAFFRTERYVTNAWRPDRYPAWPGDQAYAHRAVDQGIGRALWFVNGANPHATAACIGRYPASRHADLWSGSGLASVYAGGVDAGGLATLRELAGAYRPDLAQGAVFAAKTRQMTGLVTPHTELAVKTHCEMTVHDAAAVMDQTRVELPPDGPLPAYEIWRSRIQDRFR